MRYTGPNFEIESGMVKEWELTADTTPEAESTAVLRLGRRVLNGASLSLAADGAPDAGAYTYTTVYQDDELEIVGDVIEVSLPTADLPGIEYLWQLDLLGPDSAVVQRWRGVLVITAGLSSL